MPCFYRNESSVNSYICNLDMSEFAGEGSHLGRTIGYPDCSNFHLYMQQNKTFADQAHENFHVPRLYNYCCKGLFDAAAAWTKLMYLEKYLWISVNYSQGTNIRFLIPRRKNAVKSHKLEALHRGICNEPPDTLIAKRCTRPNEATIFLHVARHSVHNMHAMTRVH